MKIQDKLRELIKIGYYIWSVEQIKESTYLINYATTSKELAGTVRNLNYNQIVFEEEITDE